MSINKNIAMHKKFGLSILGQIALEKTQNGENLWESSFIFFRMKLHCIIVMNTNTTYLNQQTNSSALKLCKTTSKSMQILLEKQVENSQYWLSGKCSHFLELCAAVWSGFSCLLTQQKSASKFVPSFLQKLTTLTSFCMVWILCSWSLLYLLLYGPWNAC